MAATYNNDHPPLAGLASGAPESPAAGRVAAGTPLNDQDTHAAERQLLRRKALLAAGDGRATAQEVADAANRHFRIQAENAMGAAAGATLGAPAWAVQMQQQLTQQIQGVQRDMQRDLRREIQGVQREIQGVQRELRHIQARQHNSTAGEPEDTILPIEDATGQIPPNFPATRRDLEGLSFADLGTLLAFHGLPQQASTRDRRHRLEKFLGMHPSV